MGKEKITEAPKKNLAIVDQDQLREIKNAKAKKYNDSYLEKNRQQIYKYNREYNKEYKVKIKSLKEKGLEPKLRGNRKSLYVFQNGDPVIGDVETNKVTKRHSFNGQVVILRTTYNRKKSKESREVINNNKRTRDEDIRVEQQNKKVKSVNQNNQIQQSNELAIQNERPGKCPRPFFVNQTPQPSEKENVKINQDQLSKLEIQKKLPGKCPRLFFLNQTPQPSEKENVKINQGQLIKLTIHKELPVKCPRPLLINQVAIEQDQAIKNKYLKAKEYREQPQRKAYMKEYHEENRLKRNEQSKQSRDRQKLLRDQGLDTKSDDKRKSFYVFKNGDPVVGDVRTEGPRKHYFDKIRVFTRLSFNSMQYRERKKLKATGKDVKKIEITQKDLPRKCPRPFLINQVAQSFETQVELPEIREESLMTQMRNKINSLPNIKKKNSITNKKLLPTINETVEIINLNQVLNEENISDKNHKILPTAIFETEIQENIFELNTVAQKEDKQDNQEKLTHPSENPLVTENDIDKSVIAYDDYDDFFVSVQQNQLLRDIHHQDYNAGDSLLGHHNNYFSLSKFNFFEEKNRQLSFREANDMPELNEKDHFNFDI